MKYAKLHYSYKLLKTKNFFQAEHSSQTCGNTY